LKKIIDPSMPVSVYVVWSGGASEWVGVPVYSQPFSARTNFASSLISSAVSTSPNAGMLMTLLPPPLIAASKDC
jgi:hypothetical protein